MPGSHVNGMIQRSPLPEIGHALMVWVALFAAPAAAVAQQPVSLDQAIEAALVSSPRSLIGRADSAAAAAGVSWARAWPNPLAAVGYSKSVPQYHATIDFAIDYPWLRNARVGAAEASARAAEYRMDLHKAMTRYDVEIAYTLALATRERARTSRWTARSADSLLAMTGARRDAGDASDLDVMLATITAGQLANAAIGDSTAAVAALVEVQQLMGLPGGTPQIELTDTLAMPAEDIPAAPGAPLPVAAAAADLTAAQAVFDLQRHQWIPAPSLQLGVEGHDPTGSEPGVLPLIGISFALPLFSQNHGGVALAQAGQDRARAELAQSRLQADAVLGGAERDFRAALDRARRGAELAGTASRIVAMAHTAYAEGAVSLPYVLEAERSAREAVNQYTIDLAAAVSARAALRLFTASVPTP